MDDPNPLRCVDSNHVPGCEHFPNVPMKVVVTDLVPPDLAIIVDDVPTAVMAAIMSNGRVKATVAPPLGLRMPLDVNVTRAGRLRCPRCGQRRQLFRLTAFSRDQPIGHGEARCLECAGLRTTR